MESTKTIQLENLKDVAVRAECVKLKDGSFALEQGRNGGWTTIVCLGANEAKKVRNGEIILKGEEVAKEIEVKLAPSCDEKKESVKLARAPKATTTLLASQYSDIVTKMLTGLELPSQFSALAEVIGKNHAKLTTVNRKKWSDFSEFQPGNMSKLTERYQHLNKGQQRMMVGILLRSALRDINL